MGNFWSTPRCNILDSETQKKILFVGLDAAGKTTIFYKLNLYERITLVPIIGFNVETVEYKNAHFTSWDIGGEERIRRLKQHFYQNISDIIFVIDCNDVARIQNAKEELFEILEENSLQGLPLLIFANKQDLPNSVTSEVLTELLDLKSLKNRDWFVQPCTAITGKGLYEGLDWLYSKAYYYPQRFDLFKSARK